MALPSTTPLLPRIPRAHAVSSNGNNYWSAFGPRVDNLLYTVYTDFTDMFTAFTSGQLDISDWPIQAPDLGPFSSNPDFFVTPGQGEFGIFEVDLNHQDNFLTVAWQTARTTGTPSLAITGTAACGTCPAGSFQLIVNLKNLEEGGAAVLDPNNLVTATITGASTPAATKGDDANPAPAGTYTLPPLSSIPASYIISTTIYSGSVTLFTSGTTAPVCATGNTCTATFNINYNSAGSAGLNTKKPSVAGIEIFRAISHLVDKPSFLTGPYLTPPGGLPLADCVDVQAPAAQHLLLGIGAGACNHNSSPSAAAIAADCASHTWLSPCSLVSLYNLSPDSIKGGASCATNSLGSQIPTAICFPSQSTLASSTIGYSGPNDLRAACDHFVAAGFTIVPAGATCADVAAGNVVGGVTAHLSNNGSQIIMYIRTHKPRRAYGTIIADELNFLFGTPANTPAGTPGGGTVLYGGPPSFAASTTPVYFTISQIASIVFSVAVVADWNLYTGGFFLGSTPDHLFALYHSQFASNLCGDGGSTTFPNNYPIFCDPVFDTQVNAGENVPGITFPGFQAAAVLGATRGATIAVYSGVNRFVGLNAWNLQTTGTGTGSSLTSVQGHGFEAAAGFWPTLNMRPVPGYVPTNSLYYASGCNPSTGCEQNTIRRGTSQSTLHMSPFTADTVWEFEFLAEIYDSMLAVDPNSAGLCQTQPGGTAHCLDWGTTSHSFSFDPATNHVTQTWNLRSDIFFHDGVPVTAHDVCFSLLAYRDSLSTSFASVANLVSCTTVGSKIVQTVLTGNSPFNELNIGGLLIVPEHVWASICGGLVAGTDSCVTPSGLTNLAFDPVAAGDMVGSGAWVCNPSVGVSTIAGQASCTQNANGSAGGQALGAGGRILLKRNLGYTRCCANIQTPENGLVTTNLQALEWADANKDGKVTILDIALAATKFGSADPYFAHPLYSSTPSAGTVDIGDIATIAFFFDHGVSAPFLGTPTGPLTATTPAGITQFDPRTDPYDEEFALPGGVTVYSLSSEFNGTIDAQGVVTAAGNVHARIVVVVPPGAAAPLIAMNVYIDFAGNVNVQNDGGGHSQLLCGTLAGPDAGKNSGVQFIPPIGGVGTFRQTAECNAKIPVMTDLHNVEVEIYSGGLQLFFIEFLGGP